MKLSLRPERAIWLLTAALAVTGALFALRAGWGSPPWWGLPVFVAAVALTEWASVRVVVARQGVTFALNDAVMAVAFLLLHPGAWVAVGMALGFVIVKFRSRPWLKLSYNLAQTFLASVTGVVVAGQLGGGVVAACLGLATYAVLNHLLVGLPIAVTSGVPYHRVVSRTTPIALVSTVGNLSMGVLAGWLAVREPAGLLGLVVPVGLLWWSYRQQTQQASEAQLFAELARGQERVGGSVDASAQVITTAAARLFGADHVEMVLRHPDGLLRYVGDDRGVSVRERADTDAMDAPWVLRALAGRGVMIGHDGGRPFWSAVLGDAGWPLAVLIAHRPEKSAAFTRNEIQVAEALAGQAESWLSVAEMSARHDVAVGRAEAYGAASRVLGDLGADTVPALAVLRESAHRLSRLASGYDGPDAVSEIVAELYSVERAVASLLGAISLASGGEAPAELTVGTVPAKSGGDAEWTTTGRLEDAVGP